MYCPSCNTYNPENAVFCSQCAAKLSNGVQASEKALTPPNHAANALSPLYRALNNGDFGRPLTTSFSRRRSYSADSQDQA